MIYKDKDKQREANRERQRRYKDRQKALLSEGVTDKALPEPGIMNIWHNEALEKMDLPSPARPKRGKDIKCFADLPLDVQKTIDRMSINKDGTVNQTIKANRTAAAIKYQHLFPNSYEPNHPDVRDETNTSPMSFVVTGEPGDEDYNGVCTEAWRAERGR